VSRRVRLGLYAGGGVLLGVLLFAGLVWRAEGVTIDRIMRDPIPANVVIVRLELGALPGLQVSPGANVEVKCDADNDGESIVFVCEAREKVRAK
jgi:hypothetical protein